jgi:predicted TIM-barrel fold metal-dependent hydrolase
VLDPVWAACVETELPISQHGGAGMPVYSPPGFAAIMTLSLEHSFYSCRSAWQMIVGGVFDRFPDLRLALIETEVHFLIPAIEKLDQRMAMGDDWTEFAAFMNRERAFSGRASEYFLTNCYAGVSPFDPRQIPIDDLVGKDEHARALPGFHIGSANSMFGVDYPHFESIHPATMDQVRTLVGHPSVDEDDASRILFDNAAQCYGFDVDALAPHVARVGFDVDGHTVSQPACTPDVVGGSRG